MRTAAGSNTGDNTKRVEKRRKRREGGVEKKGGGGGQSPTSQFWSSAAVVFPETSMKHGKQNNSSFLLVEVLSGFEDIYACRETEKRKKQVEGAFLKKNKGEKRKRLKTV